MFRCFICVMILFSLCSGILYGEEKLSRPQGICYDFKGRLYVADTGNQRVLIFNQNLKLKNVIGTGKTGTASGEFGEPMDVAVDSKGRIVVADSRNHRIQIFSPDLKFLLQFGKEGQSDSEIIRLITLPIGIA